MLVKQYAIDHIKNIGGWSTNRKIVLFSVDDYGSVRLDSINSKNTLIEKGIPFTQGFDALDSLENREDLEALFSVLGSFKDKRGRLTCFTPCALSKNLNFESIIYSGYTEVIIESVPNTVKRLSRQPDSYKDAWSMWRKGMKLGFLMPEFHGSERLNLRIFEKLLNDKSDQLRVLMENNSFISFPVHKEFLHGWSAVFAYKNKEENARLSDFITSGISLFERVYGFKPKCFTPLAQHFPVQLDSRIKKWGLEAID